MGTKNYDKDWQNNLLGQCTALSCVRQTKFELSPIILKRSFSTVLSPHLKKISPRDDKNQIKFKLQ